MKLTAHERKYCFSDPDTIVVGTQNTEYRSPPLAWKRTEDRGRGHNRAHESRKKRGLPREALVGLWADERFLLETNSSSVHALDVTGQHLKDEY